MNKSSALISAEKHIQKRELSAAIHTYIEILKNDPSDVLTMNALGDLYVRIGNIPQAIRYFWKITDYYQTKGFGPKALAMLKKIVKLDPNHLNAEIRLAELYAGQGNLKEAFARFLRVATQFEKKGKWRETVEVYQKIVEFEPLNAEAYHKLGELYAGKGMRVKAIHAYLKAAEEFLRKNESERSLVSSFKVLDLDPENIQALERVTAIYLKKGQPEWAIKAIGQALEVNSANPDILMLQAHTYFHAGMFDEAEKCLQTVFALDSSRSEELLEFSRAFLRIGDIDRAITCLDNCLEDILAKQEEVTAIALLQQALAVDSGHKGARERLAKINNWIGELFPMYLQSSEFSDTNAGHQTKSFAKADSLLSSSRKQVCGKTPVPAVAEIIEIDLSAAFSEDMTLNQSARLDSVERQVLQQRASNSSMGDWFSPIGNDIESLQTIEPQDQAKRDETQVNQTYELILNAFSNLLSKILTDQQVRLTSLEPASQEQTGFLSGMARDTSLQQGTNRKRGNKEWAYFPANRLAGNPVFELPERLKNDRRVERYEWRLPVRVISQNGNWQECTESLDISPLGIKLKLQRPAEKGMVLRIEMLMPQPFRLQNIDARRFEAISFVCYVERTDEKNIVGLEFGAIL
jgi:tetratricopeptide (TPR) repeat protein